MNRHGYCSSYSEVKNFERCASVAENTVTLDSSPHFIQFVADNVDHNVRTLDSKNTFHGIIAAFSPRTRTNTANKRVDVTSKDIAAVGHINIDRFTSEEYILHYMYYEHLSEPKRIYPHLKLDLIWKISPLLRISRPLWSGFMQTVYKGDHPPASSVMLFPVIDLDPHDLTCTHSTLSLCFHQQIQEWKENDYHVKPQEWGWKTSEEKFLPNTTDLQPAPQKLLEIIRCNCKSRSNTMRCTCRNHGMVCSMECSECRDVCANMETISADRLRV